MATQVIDKGQATVNAPPMSEAAKDVLAGKIRQLLDERFEEINAAAAKSGRVPLSEPGAPDDGPSDGFKSFDAFLSAAHAKGNMGVNDVRVKVLQEDSGEAGGFLVPEEFRAQLLKLSQTRNFMREMGFVFPMGASVSWPRVVETTRTTTIHGGISARWEGESETADETQPVFGLFTLRAKKLKGITRSSDEFNADSSIAVGSMLEGMFAEALAHFELDAFLNGNGVTQPVGVLSSANNALITVAKETNQAADSIVLDNILKMAERIFDDDFDRAVWLAGSDLRSQLWRMSLSVGTGGSAVFLPNTSIAGTPHDTILGRPLIYSGLVPKLGDAGDLSVIVPDQYYIGDRQQFTVSSSSHEAFSTDQIIWKFIQRLDAAPWLNNAVTPKNGGPTQSHYVSLAERA